MPGHAAAAGSNVGGLLEGFLSGATTGLEVRGRRDGRRRLAGAHAHRACLVRSDAFQALSREPIATDSEIPLGKPFSGSRLT